MRLKRYKVMVISQAILLAQLHLLAGKIPLGEESLKQIHPPLGDADTRVVEAVDVTTGPEISSAGHTSTSSSHPVNKPSPIPPVAQIHQSEEKEIPSSWGNFERVIEPIRLDSAPIQVTKWKSKETGLTVVWADVEGPLINGYLIVPTEIFNDSGIPHTLEHLVFLGSEQYPYKGILDTLANRSFADGTNAYTTDMYTAYTITTAGSDGFLRILPIYLDHVFHPTITDEAFTTEVYHINGEGQEGGVVFSEMQGSENTPADLESLRKKHALFPPNSAFRSHTGGLMDALRVLNVEQIREYHRAYYQPYNFQLIVTGKLDPSELLKVLDTQVEPILIEHGQNKKPADWKRPFLETPSKGGPRLEKDETVEVEFPEKDESIGEVSISWVGPNVNEFLLQTALDVIFIYLTDSAVSPLAKKFIEIDSPLCTSITPSLRDAEKKVLTIYLSSVPNKHLDTIGDLIKKAISEEVSKLDMNRLEMVIQRSALQKAYGMEMSADATLPWRIVANFLYGVDSDLVSDLQFELHRYKVLASWTADQWLKVFNDWLVDKPSLCTIARPSKRLSNELEAKRTQIVKANQRKYGPDGLKKLADKLARAQEINSKPHPDELIENFPTPPAAGIHWIDVDIANSMQNLKTPLQSHLDSKDPAVLPYFVQFNHIKSNFIAIHINLSPSNLPPKLIRLLPTYLDSFFSLPIKKKDGTQLPYDEVVHQLNQQTIDYAISSGSLSQTIELRIRVDKDKYADAITWLRDLLYGSVFDVDRLRISATKYLQNIPSYKRDGDIVAVDVYNQITFDANKSPILATNILEQELNLPIILERLESEPENLIKDMEELRHLLIRTSSMRIGVVGDIYSLDKPKTNWLQHFEPLKAEKLKEPLRSEAVLTPEAIKPSGKIELISMPFMETSYAYFAARGPQGFNHPDEAALSVTIEFLNASEGYLYNVIRGAGLAYDSDIGYDIQVGHVWLHIDESGDSYQVFLQVGKLFKDLVDRKLKLDETMLESVKSSAVFTAASKIATGSATAYRAFIDVALKGGSKDMVKQRLERTKSVTIEDVLRIIEKYLLPIFDPENSFAAITSDSTKCDYLYQKLDAYGYNVEVKKIEIKQTPTEGDNHDPSESNIEEAES